MRDELAFTGWIRPFTSQYSPLTLPSAVADTNRLPSMRAPLVGSPILTAEISMPDSASQASRAVARSAAIPVRSQSALAIHMIASMHLLVYRYPSYIMLTPADSGYILSSVQTPSTESPRIELAD